MVLSRRDDGSPVAPRQAVASAIQDLVAARLARSFVPAGLLFLAGLAELGVRGPADGAALLLSAGAAVSAGAMLAHGLCVVQNAFGRRPRLWMTVARWGSFTPLLYGLYVLGWRGLRELAMGEGLARWGLGISFAFLGTWVLRSWTRVVEVEQLARLMTFDLDKTGEEA
jgi:hypothetical protein